MSRQMLRNMTGVVYIIHGGRRQLARLVIKTYRMLATGRRQYTQERIFTLLIYCTRGRRH